MKNLLSIFVFAVLVLSTSCSKETLVVPQIDSLEFVEEQLDGKTITGDASVEPQTLETQETTSASVTLQIQVDEVSSSQVSGELLVDFSSNYDFTETVLEDTQYLDFEDANGNVSTLTFTVNSYTGDVNSLDVAFAIGSNDLTGLELLSRQDIIIHDEIMN